MLKKGFIFLFVMILCCGVLPISAKDSGTYVPCDTRLWVDNQLVQTDTGFVTQNGSLLVPVQIVEEMGASFQWSSEDWMIQISSENKRLTMYMKNYQCANGAKVEKMPAQPTVFQGTAMIPLRYVAENLGHFVLWSGKDVYVSTTGEFQLITETNEEKPDVQPSKSLMKKTVVIDPGHGGSDPGAVSGKINEKDLNLQVAKILKDLLDQKGMTVYMTRSEDRYVGLHQRAEFANNLKADLFVSIHHNASPNTAAQGVMTLFYPTSNNQKMNGRRFAEIVQRNMVEELKTRDWGIIARPNLVVTRRTKMPAVIAELGFMTNKAELDRLVTYEFQKQAAEALYKSVLEALQN